MKRAILAAVLALAAPLAAAQDYPAREIRSLCNFSAGSGADIIVRFYSDRLAKLAGKPVIVENKVGANGALATDALAKSKPDGYTILITPASSTIASAPYLFKSLPFDTEKDFAAVTTIASLSFVIMVDASRPLHSINDLVAQLKSKPNNGFYGSTSNTGVIAAELFKAKVGLGRSTSRTSRTCRRSPICSSGSSISSPSTRPGRRGRRKVARSGYSRRRLPNDPWRYPTCRR
jgi:tripartite-type tricarboxylate transporter receptor subunit TctC